MDLYNGMGGIGGIGSSGSRIEDYLKGGSKVVIGGEPYEVYKISLDGAQGAKSTAYVLVPAGYGKMPKGQNYGQKATQPKAEMPKTDYSGKGLGRDMPDKYSKPSGKMPGLDRYASGTAKGTQTNPYKEKKDTKARK